LGLKDLFNIAHSIREVDIDPESMVYIKYGDDEYRANSLIFGKEILIGSLENWFDPNFCDLALNIDARFIKYAKIVSEETKYQAIMGDPTIIKYINDPSEEMKLQAVRADPSLIKYIEDPCEEAQMIAVQYNPYFIEYIDNPCEKIQKMIIENNIPYY